MTGAANSAWRLLPYLAVMLVVLVWIPHPAGASAARHEHLVSVVVSGGELRSDDLPDAVVGRHRVPALGFDRLTVPGAAADAVIEALRHRGFDARRDSQVYATRSPNDPLYAGQSAYGTIRAETAWDRTVGTPQTIVAVLDTGVNEDHRDLQGAVVSGWDFVNDDADPHDDDPTSHGTSVTGVVAARTDNRVGVAGTCWECRVMPLKVLDNNGSGSTSVVAEAIVYATDHGADIINMSLAGPDDDPTVERAVEYATSRDVLVIAAAGNQSSSTPRYPAAYPEVIGVASSTPNDGRHAFSNYGSWVSVAAPGCITSTTGSATYGEFCGTSASAPLAAGLAGLIRSVRPDLAAVDVRRLIEEGALPVGNWVDHGRVDAPHSIPVSPPKGNLYRAVDPARILDTRTTNGGHLGKLGHRDALRLQVAGRGGIPTSGVAAVVLNVTVTHPTNESYLTVFPSGTSRPVASNLNFVPNQTIPNLVTVKLGTAGSVDIFNFSGSTHVVVDVAGYYVERGGGAMFRALKPARILDTRNGTGGHSSPIAGDSAIAVRVAGRGGVPRYGVTAVAINVTAVNATRDSFLTVYPAGSSRPTASTVNFGKDDIIPNMAIAKLGRDGRVSIYNFAGPVDVVVDVMGYFTLTRSGASFHPLAPARAVDTRNGTGGSRSPLGHRSARAIALTGVAGVPTSGVAAVVTNVTAVEPTATETYLSVYPTGTSRPTASNLNLRRGEIFPNLVTATIGDKGTVEVYNHSGSTHLVVDVSGFYDN
ncbi:MAG: S8 family serine peptidase [Nitriliruptorales bacterium]|nr:S8 family serine peptidase [Nitriliruptorales bacterium]